MPYGGMAIFPIILLKNKNQAGAQALRHEKIHLRQQAETLLLPFYVFYLLHYLFNQVRYRNHHKAYLNIVFEREAYACDADENYLAQRPMWAFVNFF